MGFCWNGFGWGAWGGLGTVGLVLSLVFFAAVLGVGTAWLVWRLGRRPLVAQMGADPLEIARRRLAAGEITVAQFEEIRDRLQS